MMWTDQESTWQRWFAWYPIRLTDGTNVWLEWVERYHCTNNGGLIWYDYRRPGDTTAKTTFEKNAEIARRG